MMKCVSDDEEKDEADTVRGERVSGWWSEEREETRGGWSTRVSLDPPKTHYVNPVRREQGHV